MRNDCTTDFEMSVRRGGVHSMLCAPIDVLPSLARPGLFGD
jgi:hypothetical protein